MAAAFNDVTSGEALAECRWNNHRPGERQPHLAAMRMASQGECNSVRDEAEDVGIVRQQENRRATVGDWRQCGGQIMPTGPQVADACDPQQAGLSRWMAVSSTTRMPIISSACRTRSWSNQPSWLPRTATTPPGAGSR